MRSSMCSRLHRADGDPADDLVEVRTGMDRLAVDALEDHRQGRVGQDRPVRQDAQQRDAVAGQPVFERAGEPRLGVEVDLVDDRAGDLDAVPLEQRGVEHDLVDRPPDAALRHDDRRRAEHRRHGRVREADDGPDPGVPGALDEQDVAIGEGRVGLADAGRQVGHDVALDVGLGEPARDVDRAHLPERLAQPEDLLHEHGVLVGGHPVLDDRALADGLQEAGRQVPPLEPVEHAQADRGLAPVLAGGREIDVAHRAAPLSCGWRSCARSAGSRRAAGSGSRPPPRRARDTARAAP